MDASVGLEVRRYIGGRSTSVEQRGPHEGGGRAQGGRRAPLPRALLVDVLT